MNIWELPPKSKPGRELEVTVYNDAKESLKATILKPFAALEQFAALKVKTVNDWGAFLEWGLPKDLFLPSREQIKPVRPGEKIVVRVILDHEKKGLIATAKLDSHFNYSPDGLNPGDPAELLVFEEIKIGFGVVVAEQYRGMIYKNEIFQQVDIGQRLNGTIKKIREDGRIDCSLPPLGFNASMEAAKETIVSALEEQRGFLPLHDKSSPEEIASVLNISKKNFKKASGILFREGKIVIEDQGIRQRKHVSRGKRG
ncbi:hypothetical protein [Marispirochaeta sp.]|uniref:CvfB family protein n=1 Tax=Marispirochaeta sp. TaxID=2038653 RepID=UPI0029C8C020|nr:hypothetical protein [Marispirochaeta sp.]